MDNSFYKTTEGEWFSSESVINTWKNYMKIESFITVNKYVHLIYSIIAANLKCCLYLHCALFVRMSYTAIYYPNALNIHTYQRQSVRIFRFHFFPFTQFVCVNKNNTIYTVTHIFTYSCHAMRCDAMRVWEWASKRDRERKREPINVYGLSAVKKPWNSRTNKRFQFMLNIHIRTCSLNR